MKNSLTEYPVDHEGNLLDYVTTWSGSRTVPNVPFVAGMKFDTITRGRSAIKFHMVEISTGKSWPVFATDMLEIVKTLDIFDGEVYATWIVGKRGSNYGLRPIKKEAKPTR